MIGRLAVFLGLLASGLLKTESSKAAVTFNRDVAPIFAAHCVSCHRANGAGAFPLSSYADAKKRAQLIRKVTASRYMPPWLPERGHGDFKGERLLSEAEIKTIADWVKGGAAEGAKKDLVPFPTFPSEWQLGTPDLVVTLPKAYSLPSEGRDVYRNFVIPHVSDQDRYVRAMEFRPGSPAVHHAFVQVDGTGEAERLEAGEGAPGFPGMQAGRGAHNPGGFMSWQPGRQAAISPEGMAWKLNKNEDLILQLHLRSTGKQETVQPKVALYFTDERPTRPNLILLLRPPKIDIPAGDSAYAVESAYQLPVDISLIGILPHMHYLGKEAYAWVEKEDGSTEDLLLIKRWDFNWQSDYRYREPLHLPRGATLHMRMTYNNSAQNPRNPHQPPQRTQYGLQTTDEMGEMWFWAETASSAEAQALQQNYLRTWALPDKLAINQALVDRDPSSAERRTEFAVAQNYSGQSAEAIKNLQRAVADDPKYERAYYALGTIFTKARRLPEAETAFQAAVRLDPRDANAQANLGYVCLQEGKREEAAAAYERALALNPNDSLARAGLLQARGHASR